MCKTTKCEQAYKTIIDINAECDFGSALSYLRDADIELMDLTQENANSYYQKFGIAPGYIGLYYTFACLAQEKPSCDKEYSRSKAKQIDYKLNDIIKHDVKRKTVPVVCEIGNAQKDWQRPYIFYTYLLYRFLEQPEINSVFTSLLCISTIDICKMSMMIKLLSTTEIRSYLASKQIDHLTVFYKICDDIQKKLPHLTIDEELFYSKQKQNIVNAGFDVFSSRVVLRDYPFIRLKTNEIVVTTLSYLQSSIFTRTVGHIIKNGGNTKMIGSALEKVVFDEFSRYSSVCMDSLKDGTLFLNPGKKGCELCDVLVKNGSKYLLIDCKSKEFIEDVYSDDNHGAEKMYEAFLQRNKRATDIEDGLFSAHFPTGTKKEQIYSIIVVLDDSVFPKEFVLNKCFDTNDINLIDYARSHIHIISYDDLLEMVVSDTDIIKLIDKAISAEACGNPLRTFTSLTTKGDYNLEYNQWYEKVSDVADDLIGYCCSVSDADLD